MCMFVVGGWVGKSGSEKVSLGVGMNVNVHVSISVCVCVSVCVCLCTCVLFYCCSKTNSRINKGRFPILLLYLVPLLVHCSCLLNDDRGNEHVSEWVSEWVSAWVSEWVMWVKIWTNSTNERNTQKTTNIISTDEHWHQWVNTLQHWWISKACFCAAIKKLRATGQTKPARAVFKRPGHQAKANLYTRLFASAFVYTWLDICMCECAHTWDHLSWLPSQRTSHSLTTPMSTFRCFPCAKFGDFQADIPGASLYKCCHKIQLIRVYCFLKHTLTALAMIWLGSMVCVRNSPTKRRMTYANV